MRRKHSILADLSFLAIWILIFVAVLFLAYDQGNLASNGILLCIATLLFLITYFTSLRVGMITDAVFVALLVAYLVIQSVGKGGVIPANVYFWIFWPLCMLVVVAGFVEQSRKIDRENEELVRQAEKFITIDQMTQMNNLLGFERDAAVYMNISRRYRLQMELVLWRLTYQEELERLLGREKMQEAICSISDSIQGSLRREDLAYLADQSPYIWGTLLFSNPDAAEIVIHHVKEGVMKTVIEEVPDSKHYLLDISGTVLTYDGSVTTPLALLNKGKQQLWGNISIAPEKEREEQKEGEEEKSSSEKQTEM